MFQNITFGLFSLILTGYAAALAHLLVSVLIALVFWLASRFLKGSLIPRLIQRAGKSHLKATPILVNGFAKPVPVLVWGCGIYLALENAHRAFSFIPSALLVQAFHVLIIGMVGWGLWNSADLCLLLLGSAAARFDLGTNQTLSRVLYKFYKVVVVLLCAIAALDEFGFPVTGLVTGVGLTGLTLSLAAQDSASNLFSGMMILLEHPFGIGDWISVGSVEGIVEDISFRSTKIRALDNTLYVVPNSSVSGAVINNGTKREKRLFRFTLGVTYDATRAQLEHLMQDLEALLKNSTEVYADSVVVKLTGFGSSSIDILVSAYVKTPDLGKFMEIQNALNLDIMDVMKRNGTSFAFPSTSVYIEKTAEVKA